VGGYGGGWWQGVPALPTEDQARVVLSGWARRTRFVPDTLFDGPLVVDDASVVWMQVARLIETRTEAPAKVPGTLGQLATYTDLRSHRVEGDEWQELDWHGVRQGSVTTESCDTCRGRTLVACATCGGRALVRCPRTVTCEACGGTGRFFTRQGSPEFCLACHGIKKVTCELCEGDGKRPCTDCVGGQVGCATCGATGVFTGYQAGWIRRTIDHTTVRAGAGKAIVRPADVDLYQLVPTSEQAPDLSLLPVLAQVEPTLELTRRVPGERRRKVQLLVLPVVAVSYQDRGVRTAYLLGLERRVRAPGARRPRWRWPSRSR
jgi:hypothetical protein